MRSKIKIDTFGNVLNTTGSISFQSEEKKSKCPHSAVEETIVYNISYVPNKKCIAVESIDEMIDSRLNLGASAEETVQGIFDVLDDVLDPFQLMVEGSYHVEGRGLLTVTVGSEE